MAAPTPVPAAEVPREPASPEPVSREESTPAPAAPEPSPPTAAEPAAAPAASEPPTPAPEAPTIDGEPSPAQPAAVAGGLDVAAIRRAWPDILGWIFKHKRTTWTLLSEHATVHDYDGSKVVLGISTVGIANTFRHGPHADLVRQALIDVLGVDARVEGIPTPDAGQSAPSGESHPTVVPANRYPSDDPAVKGDNPSPSPRGASDGGAASTGAGGGGGPAAYAGIAASSPPPETGGGWATASSGPSSGPSWASDDAPGGATAAPSAVATEPTQTAPAEPGTGSRLAAAKAAVAAEEPARTPDAYVADDSAASADDEDIAELGEVGRPVIERLLGGKVIDEGP